MRWDYNDTELKALILDWLVRHGRWGAHYFPLDTLDNKLSHVVRNNGRRTRKFVKELANDGHLLLHKRDETVSLNPARSKEIMELIERIA